MCLSLKHYSVLITRITHNLLIYSLRDGHGGCFQLFALINSAASHVIILDSEDTCVRVSLGSIFRPFWTATHSKK